MNFIFLINPLSAFAFVLIMHVPVHSLIERRALKRLSSFSTGYYPYSSNNYLNTIGCQGFIHFPPIKSSDYSSNLAHFPWHLG